MKITKNRSVCILILSMIICFGLLAGCGNKLSGDFDEAKVKSAAENVIALVNQKDSEGLKEICTAQMKQGLTDEVLKQVYEAIDEAGAFENMENMSVAGASEQDEELALVIAKAKYENKSYIYTISFTKDMKLAGLYYK